MSSDLSTDEQQSLPVFEIDSQDEFGQFLLNDVEEIAFYLDLLAKRHNPLTVYIDNGQHFFQSSIVAVDEAEASLFLTPSQAADDNALAQAANRITLVSKLDRVKMQLRLPPLKAVNLQGQALFSAPIPATMLRLQRREYFRLEPPPSAPIRCRLTALRTEGTAKVFDLPLSDISGGGLSLVGELEMADYFVRDTLFADCRLDIPGQGVILVNLRVRKVIEFSPLHGDHNLRIGCEFVNLPASRLDFIEHYIARVERERRIRQADLSGQ